MTIVLSLFLTLVFYTYIYFYFSGKLDNFSLSQSYFPSIESFRLLFQDNAILGFDENRHDQSMHTESECDCVLVVLSMIVPI